MIRYSEIAGTLRFWDDDDAPYGTRYDASIVIQWESPKAVMLTAFTVNAGFHVTRKLLRELVEKMVELGVERMRSTREKGRLLPLAKLQPDGTFLNDVAELVEYCASVERRRYPPGVRPPAPPPEGKLRRQGEKDWQPTEPAGLMDGHPPEDQVRATDPPAEPVRRAPPGPADDPPEGTPT